MKTLHRSPRILILSILIWGFLPSGAVAGPHPSSAALSAGLSPAALFVDEETNDDASAEEVRYSSRELRVQVWHDKDDDDVYQRGEALQLFFRTNEDAYVVLYYIDADGYTEVLWPTSRYDDGFVFGGHTYSIPGRGSEEGMWVSQSKGVEYAEAIASKYPFDLRELALDFRFDPEATGEYAHRVSGDPFLAVNDINYAITGLEEDVDWIVTDWTHIYVDRKVDYPRYTCTQCHTSKDEQYEPYAQSCTRVQVYADWGWYSSWYLRFGYYPLYCDAPYYYWDPWYSRPYYFTYYPVWYSWPGYPVYVRPYPVYAWNTTGAYRGDYITLYQRGTVHDQPLYDLSRREISKGRDRGLVRTPPSVGAPRTAKGGSRVRSDQLTHNPMPRQSRDSGDLMASRGGRGSPRVGVRTERGPSGRTLRSLHPETTRPGAGSVQRPSGRGDRRTRETRGDGEVQPRDSRTSSSSGSSRSNHGRRWTRPIVRNTPEGGDRGRSSSPRVIKSPKRGFNHPKGKENPAVKSRSKGSSGKKHVAPRGSSSGGSRGSGRVSPPPSRSSGGSRGSGRVSPPPSRSSGGSRGGHRAVSSGVASSRRSPSASRPSTMGSRSGGSRGGRG